MLNHKNLKSRISYFASIFLILMLFSCTAKNAITKPVDVNIPVSDAGFFNKIKSPPNFQSIKINSKINVDTDAFIPNLDAVIYIENDKKIWMNMSALFLNVARGMATDSGIKAYEKWNKTYIDSDFSYLNNLLGVTFIDFQSLQNLLLGRTFIPIDASDFELTKNAQGYHLASKKNQIIANGGKISEYQIGLDYSADGNLRKVFLNEIRKNETLEINYSGWVFEKGINLPKSVKIIIKSSKNTEILIENTTFAFTNMETPYSVPANYKKTEIK